MLILRNKSRRKSAQDHYSIKWTLSSSTSNSAPSNPNFHSSLYRQQFCLAFIQSYPIKKSSNSSTPLLKLGYQWIISKYLSKRRSAIENFVSSVSVTVDLDMSDLNSTSTIFSETRSEAIIPAINGKTQKGCSVPITMVKLSSIICTYPTWVV